MRAILFLAFVAVSGFAWRTHTDLQETKLALEKANQQLGILKTPKPEPSWFGQRLNEKPNRLDQTAHSEKRINNTPNRQGWGTALDVSAY